MRRFLFFICLLLAVSSSLATELIKDTFRKELTSELSKKESYNYYPYGKVLRKAENPCSCYQSTDHEKDLLSGYDDRNARWYDDEALRFNNVDPLSDFTGSFYDYCKNNPIINTDFTGEDPDKDRPGELGERALHSDGKYYSMMEKGWGYILPETIIKGKSTDRGVPDLASKIEDVLQSGYRDAPSWFTNMSNEGSWAHQGMSAIASFAMSMNLVSNAMSLYSGQDWQGEQQNRTWAAMGLVTMGLSGEVNAAKTVSSGASLSTNEVKLSQHLGQLEKYGAGGFKELANGRFRYYGQASLNRGNANSFRMVREWNPATGAKRTWFETLNPNGGVIQVRPEFGTGVKIHYLFNGTGGYLGKW